jgi:hypothetical protein
MELAYPMLAWVVAGIEETAVAEWVASKMLTLSLRRNARATFSPNLKTKSIAHHCANLA